MRKGDILTSKLISAASTNATLVSAVAATLFGLHVSNINAAARYLKLYNLAVAPTVGTTVPVMTFLIPAASNFVLPMTEIGIAFSAGIGLSLNTGAADNDTGAVSAAESIVHLFYA